MGNDLVVFASMICLIWKRHGSTCKHDLFDTGNDMVVCAKRGQIDNWMKIEDFLKNTQNWPLGFAPRGMEQKFYQKVIPYTKKVLPSKYGENWKRNEDFMKNAKIWPLRGHACSIILLFIKLWIYMPGLSLLCQFSPFMCFDEGIEWWLIWEKEEYATFVSVRFLMK